VVVVEFSLLRNYGWCTKRNVDLWFQNNEEEQSHDKRKASKRHQCQVGMCKGDKTTEKCEICFKYVCGKCTKNVEKKLYCKKCTL
jgi:hypothetical protein